MTLLPDTRKPYPRGTYSKVARKLAVTPQSVRDVALGIKRSARIARELKREQRKAQRKAARIEAAA
jgi:hypothetical protein